MQPLYTQQPVIIHPFFIDENGTIYHTRGDTGQFQFKILIDGAELSTYSATLSVKQYPDDSTYLYQVNFNQSTPCYITHALTDDLPYGEYWYDIQVTYTEGGVTQYRTIGAFPYILRPDITN